MMNLARLAAVLLVGGLLAAGCGGNGSKASPTQAAPSATVPAAQPTPDGATPSRVAPAAGGTLAAAGGHVTTGAAKSGTNAASPVRCNSPRTQFTEARIGVVTDGDGGTWQVPSPIREGDGGVDLYNDCTGSGVNAAWASQLKTVVIDPDGVEITAFIHADNYFEFSVNGTFVCRDPIAFTPFNSSACRFKAKYPLTYAFRAVDWEEHLGIGLEYDRFNVGDAGIVATFSDGTITDGTWKAETFYIAPVDDPACVKFGQGGARDSSGCPAKPACVTHDPLTTCKAIHFAEPPAWASPGFDDSAWPAATVYTREQFGPKEAYTTQETLFGQAKFIWSRNLNIDNLVLLRKTVAAPPPR